MTFPKIVTRRSRVDDRVTQYLRNANCSTQIETIKHGNSRHNAAEGTIQSYSPGCGTSQADCSVTDARRFKGESSSQIPPPPPTIWPTTWANHARGMPTNVDHRFARNVPESDSRHGTESRQRKSVASIKTTGRNAAARTGNSTKIIGRPTFASSIEYGLPLPNAQVNPRVPTGDMIYQTRTAAHVGLNRLLVSVARFRANAGEELAPDRSHFCAMPYNACR